MKTIILAGGFGTRLSEYTNLIPKPMVIVGDDPILVHIMNHYSFYGYNNFILALGYKASYIKDYFLKYSSINTDFEIDLKNGNIKKLNTEPHKNWNITCIDTGLSTMTGGRLKRLKDYIGNERFFLTYGDGLANVDIEKLLKFHLSHGKMITMTGVRPIARFGELVIEDDLVVEFKEKPQMREGWINGGFFVIEPEFLNLIDDDETLLEREPLERAVKKANLMVYKHEGFWQCMDSKRDHENLEKLFLEGKLNFHEK